MTRLIKSPVHVRQGGRNGPTLRCEDFGAALLLCAKQDASRIIDASTVWAPLHAFPDRDFAPPPVILPFVVTASDFEDAMIWMANARPSLGLPMLDLMAMTAGADPEVNQNGTLPPAFLKQLKAIFGLPYEPINVLDRICMDEPPQGYGLS